MTHALEIKGLHYGYKGNWSFARTPVVHDVNLEVKSGESFGFLGQSGAGKTTTIKCILSLLHPTQGSIEIFGKPAQDPSARVSLGYLPEQPYFYDHLTVSETVSMFASLSGIQKSELAKAVDSSLARVSLSDRKNDTLSSLSKGLTQRVAMAQAIVANPKLLVLDEPFSGLDPVGRRQISDLLFELKEEGTTIFMSSHILSDVEAVCDRVSVMKEGRLQGVFAITSIPDQFSTATYELILKDADGLTEIFIEKSSSHTFQGSALRLSFDEKSQAVEMLQKALSSTATVEKFSFSRPSLEEVFIDIIQGKENDS